MNDNFDLKQLHQFSGSEQFFKHWGNKIIYTEGIQFLVENASCYWLLDEITLVVFPILFKKHRDSFYSIQMTVQLDHSAIIVVEDGNENIYLEHKIEFTDFPIIGQPIKFYLCESGSYYCLMLTGEY